MLTGQTPNGTLVRSTERVLLRPHRPEDISALSRIWANPKVMQYMAVPPMTEQQVTEAFERLLRPDEHVRQSYRFAIVRQSDDRVVGTVGIDKERFSAAYTHSMVMHSETWGTGLAHEAYHLLLTFGFRELAAHRIWTACAIENERARHFIESVGFTYFGTISHYYQKEGVWGDCHAFNYLVDECLSHVDKCDLPW